MRPERLYCTFRAFALAVIFLSAGASSALAVAPKVTAFTPASGTIGTSVTITGSGFTGAKTVKFDGVAATSFKVVSATKITVTAPTAITTGAISVTTAGGTGQSTKHFTATIGAQLSLSLGHPITNLTVSGAGFGGSKPVDVFFDTADLALAVSTSKGLVSIPIQTPASTQPGGHFVTLVERGSNLAVQKPFTVQTNWPMAGFVPQGRGYNPYENTVNASNANQLTALWTTRPFSVFSNQAGLVVVGGNSFVSEVDGSIHAYSSTGAVLWTATIAYDSFPFISPASANGNVFFSDSTKLYAFSTSCRKDGGVCKPIWSKTVGTGISSSMTVFNGHLYIPSADGTIHVANPTTGVEGTAIFAANKTDGRIKTPISFFSNGDFAYVAGVSIHYNLYGQTGTISLTPNASSIAIYDNAGYYTTDDAKLHEFAGAGWTATLTGTGCTTAPAVANNVVYASGCSSLGAFEAGTGTPIWSINVTDVSGLSVANGVLYACAGSTLAAYNAGTGARLWTGGACDGPVEIVNGIVYRANIDHSAYSLPGTGPDKIVAARPIPSALRPDHSLLKQPYRLPSGNQTAE